jgi:hypothetical protein
MGEGGLMGGVEEGRGKEGRPGEAKGAGGRKDTRGCRISVQDIGAGYRCRISVQESRSESSKSAQE